jgi:hypothetical protein
VDTSQALAEALKEVIEHELQLLFTTPDIAVKGIVEKLRSTNSIDVGALIKDIGVLKFAEDMTSKRNVNKILPSLKVSPLKSPSFQEKESTPLEVFVVPKFEAFKPKVPKLETEL